MADSRGVLIVVALIGAAGTIAAAFIARAGGGEADASPTPAVETVSPVVTPSPVVVTPRPVTPTPLDPTEPASVFLNRDSGPGGATVLVSGEGFRAGERVVISFHTDEIGSTTASAQGKFANVAVTIPTSYSKFAPQQFDVIARGRSSIKSARAPFTITG